MTDNNCKVSIFEYFQDSKNRSWNNLVRSINSLPYDFNNKFVEEAESSKVNINNSIDTISITGTEHDITINEDNIQNLKNSILNIYNSLPDNSKVENFENRYDNFNTKLVFEISFLKTQLKKFIKFKKEIDRLKRELEKIQEDFDSISINNDSVDVVLLTDLTKQTEKINQEYVELRDKIIAINNDIQLLTENKEELESKIGELKATNFDNLEGQIDKLKNKIIENNVNLLQHRSLLEMYNIKQKHHKKLQEAYNNENEKIIKDMAEMIQKEKDELQSEKNNLQDLEKQLTELIEKIKNFDKKKFRKEFLEENYNNKSVKTPKKSPGFGYKDDADGLDSRFEVKIEDLYGNNKDFEKMGKIFSSGDYIRNKETTDFSKIEEYNNQLNVNIQGMNSALNNLK